VPQNRRETAVVRPGERQAVRGAGVDRSANDGDPKKMKDQIYLGIRLAAALVLVAGFAAGGVSCGKTSVSACDLSANLCSCNKQSTTSNSCDDYEGKSVDDAKSACTTGTFAQAACPTTGRVGTCKLGVSSNRTYTRYYADAVASRVACEATNISLGAFGAAEWIAD
jgi:hypothetical protein